MSVTVLLVLVFFAFLSSFIQRVTGFGYGIVFMAVCPYLMPTYGEATALSGMLALVCAIVTGVQFFKHIPWKKIFPILIAFLVVSFFAVMLVKHVDSMILRKVLGIILILVSIYFYFTNGRLRIKPTVPVQLGMGTLSGMMGGLFGMQGPPAVLYFISCSERKEEYMALTQWYFIIGNIFMTFCRAGNGFVTPAVTKSFLTGVPAVLLGLYVGSVVYKRLPLELLRKVVYVFIGISGLVALFV